MALTLAVKLLQEHTRTEGLSSSFEIHLKVIGESIRCGQIANAHSHPAVVGVSTKDVLLQTRPRSMLYCSHTGLDVNFAPGIDLKSGKEDPEFPSWTVE